VKNIEDSSGTRVRRKCGPSRLQRYRVVCAGRAKLRRYKMMNTVAEWMLKEFCEVA
jgi:hypothetical protein